MDLEKIGFGNTDDDNSFGKPLRIAIFSVSISNNSISLLWNKYFMNVLMVSSLS
jgi:hypothetical protein